MVSEKSCQLLRQDIGVKGVRMDQQVQMDIDMRRQEEEVASSSSLLAPRDGAPVICETLGKRIAFLPIGGRLIKE